MKCGSNQVPKTYLKYKTSNILTKVLKACYTIIYDFVYIFLKKLLKKSILFLQVSKNLLYLCERNLS